ncbi:hypothetical protein [Streptomyces sp. TRM64462]|uniref:hypothetical protein n=1 Tax=Streptomyces sp. TRM64462 TaxID=2741726 RepID=UPI001585E561|nr:hypothetical protein [Streptomyces sp. TRM64462]
MTEPTRYSTAPVELPLPHELEPSPVEGCAACSWLVDVRTLARAQGDMSKVSDYNVLLRRHPYGH